MGRIRTIILLLILTAFALTTYGQCSTAKAEKARKYWDNHECKKALETINTALEKCPATTSEYKQWNQWKSEWEAQIAKEKKYIEDFRSNSKEFKDQLYELNEELKSLSNSTLKDMATYQRAIEIYFDDIGEINDKINSHRAFGANFQCKDLENEFTNAQMALADETNSLNKSSRELVVASAKYIYNELEEVLEEKLKLMDELKAKQTFADLKESELKWYQAQLDSVRNILTLDEEMAETDEGLSLVKSSVDVAKKFFVNANEKAAEKEYFALKDMQAQDSTFVQKDPEKYQAMLENLENEIAFLEDSEILGDDRYKVISKYKESIALINKSFAQAPKKEKSKKTMIIIFACVAIAAAIAIFLSLAKIKK